jgi:Hemerythrin HHE cation binding domain
MMGTAKKGVTVTEQMPPAAGRRHLLGISMSAAGVIALSACGGAPPKPSQAQAGPPSENEARVTPPEDLMREHGVLKRVLLVYREEIHRLQAGEQDPTHALNSGAGIIRNFIENYHEHLEEQYVFPKLEQAGKLTDITTVLRTQHQRGRVLTDRVLAATAGAAALDQPARQALVTWCPLRSFATWPRPSKTRSTGGSVRPASKGSSIKSPTSKKVSASTTWVSSPRLRR